MLGGNFKLHIAQVTPFFSLLAFDPIKSTFRLYNKNKKLNFRFHKLVYKTEKLESKETLENVIKTIEKDIIKVLTKDLFRILTKK